MKRSKFSLSHYKLLTCKMGQLVPVTWYEALPGDTIQHSVSALIRCAPLVTPVMHPVDVRFHTFFVPNRIMWTTGSGSDGPNTGWESYITGGQSGSDSQVHPYIQPGAPAVSSLGDYLGLSPNLAAGVGSLAVSALPYRAYAMIFNEWYRDEDLVTALTVSTSSGADTTTSTSLQDCAWEKDYLTSSRPWAFKGPTVTLPIAGQAPVTGLGIGGGTASSGESYYATEGHVTGATAWPGAQTSTNIFMNAQTTGAPGSGNLPQIFADLSMATSVSINTVRQAFALQRFEEARARYGSRYTEYLRYLGVRSSDARLQRPEYLGGGKTTIQFSEVLQTAPTTAGTGGGTGGVGQFGGHGISAQRTNRYRRFFEEHGIVMTLMSVRPRTIYNDSVQRGFLRGCPAGGSAGVPYGGMTGNNQDYWQRELQHIGQQGVSSFEVDCANSPGSYTSVFGYQDRYDEYRRLESSTAGEFRNSTLYQWHLARIFGSSPSLNSTFVNCVPSTRIFADTSDDNLYVCARHSIQARRLVAKTGTSMTF